MSTTQQGSNEFGCGNVYESDNANKCEKTRRSWSPEEEEALLAALKELVAQGWKSDNGFRAGYMSKCEESIRKKFPGTDIREKPHITSRLTLWKKNYYSLTSILSRSGVGFNLNGDHKIDCDNEQWEQIVKADGNAKGMRSKPWPLLEGWIQVFGKDRATGENAEDVMEAVHELVHDENLAAAGSPGDYHVHMEDISQNEAAAEDSVCNDSHAEKPQRSAHKKRKRDDGLQSVCELLGEMHRDTSARLENLANRIGYQANLGKARNEVFDLLGNIPMLSLDEKFEVCEILVDKVERLEMFMGLPDNARPQYVMRLLKSKGM